MQTIEAEYEASLAKISGRGTLRQQKEKTMLLFVSLTLIGQSKERNYQSERDLQKKQTNKF